MAKQFTNVPEHNFSRGIDARSSENLIGPGFVEDALNADVVENRLRKRAGYSIYSGCIPLRVKTLEYINSGDKIRFEFEGALNLTDIRSKPLVAYGRTTISGSGGDFSSSDTEQYYSSFSSDPRLTFPPNALTTEIVEGEVHGFPSFNTTESFFPIVSQSLSFVDSSNSISIPQEIEVDKTSLDVSVTIDNTTSSSQAQFVSFLGTGDSSSQYSAVIEAGFDGGTNIAGFPNRNVLCKIFKDNGATWKEVIPRSFFITDADPNFLQFRAEEAGPYFLMAYSAPDNNFKTGVLAGQSSTSVNIPAESRGAFLVANVYVETPGDDDTFGAPGLKRVLPESVTYDASTDSHTITISNDSTENINFEIYYDYAEINTNFLIVDANAPVSADAVDTNPQITLWGLCQSEDIYVGQDGLRQGWVNHIDSYRRPGEERLISGLGGNLFSERDSSESPLSHPTRFVRIRNRALTQRTISPLIHTDGDTPGRSRGYWTSTGAVSNQGEITDAVYSGSGNLVDYTLSLPGLRVFDGTETEVPVSTANLLARVSTTSGFEDRVKISGCGNSRLNGTFKIRDVTLSATDTVVIRVENENISTSDYDETDVGGRLGMFTDILDTETPAHFILGDVLLSDVFTEDISVLVSSASVNEVLLEGVTGTTIVPNAILLTARRTLSVIPLRDGDGTPSVANYVEGDTLSLTGYTRELQIKNVNVLPDTSVDIAPPGTGETEATVTLGSGNTDTLTEGDSLLLTRAGDYSGEIVISRIVSSNEFRFESTETETITGATLVGNTITIDESLETEDNSINTVAINIPRRWIPIEAPDDSFSSTPSQYYRHFDAREYDDMDFLRSVTVADTLFLTDGDNEVHKFDGDSLYQAGLPAYQPDITVVTDTGATSKISIITTTASVSSFNGNRFVVGFGEEVSFSEGQSVSYDGNSYTVSRTANSGESATEGYIFVDRNITGAATGTLSLNAVFSYYVRFNAVDANQNIIASRVVRSEDLRVSLGAAAAVKFKLASLPPFGNFDYSRIELEIYRTKQSTPAPYFKLATIPIDFDGLGEVLWTDSRDDNTLTEFDLDPVNSVILGSELGTQWSDPIRSKYVTTASNSLVLANLRDLDEIKINFIEDGGSPITYATVDDATSEKVFSFSDGTNTLSYQFNSTEKTESILVRALAANNEIDINGLSTPTVGEWVYVHRDDSHELDPDLFGWFQVSRVSGLTAFINYPTDVDKSITADVLQAKVKGIVPVPAFQDFNRQTIDNNLFPSGNESKITFLLAEAINASVRRLDKTISGQENFVPFMLAYSDGSFPKGELIVRATRGNTEIAFTSPDTLSGYRLFVNDIETSAATITNGLTRLFPSRVLVSYENFSEVFDNPTTVLPSDSDSAIDVNPADGQEITGVIPFFGDAAFGAAQKSNIVVVFKTNSIYLIDINEKREGRDPVQRLETEGLGCTAPYSISVTKYGIMFANEAGMFRLTRDLRIEYIGRFMERFWLEEANRDFLEIMQGHHYGIGRRYKLSVPISNATENSDVYVYHHTGEFGETPGAWTRYDNHPATGWANLAKDAYFGTTAGQVMRIRREEDSTDFRDNDQSIAMSFLTRGLDLGTAGVRKIFSSVIAHYRALIQSDNTNVRFGVDFEEELQDTDTLRINRNSGGIDNNKIKTIKTSLGRRRGVYLQVEISNDGKDEPLDVGGLDVRAAPLKARGIKEANET